MEFLVEILAPLLSFTVGLALAAATYWIWILVRRRLWGMDKPLVVETPDGAEYSLEVPALQIRTPVSRRVFNGRRPRGEVPPSWNENDQLHPRRMLDDANSFLILVALPVLVVVVLLALIFVVEALLVLVLVGVTSAIATIFRQRWTLVVTGPYEKADPEEILGAGGRQVWKVRERGMRRIHRTRDHLADCIRAGVTTVLAQAAVSASTEAEISSTHVD